MQSMHRAPTPAHWEIRHGSGPAACDEAMELRYSNLKHFFGQWLRQRNAYPLMNAQDAMSIARAQYDARQFLQVWGHRNSFGLPPLSWSISYLGEKWVPVVRTIDIAEGQSHERETSLPLNEQQRSQLFCPDGLRLDSHAIIQTAREFLELKNAPDTVEVCLHIPSGETSPCCEIFFEIQDPDSRINLLTLKIDASTGIPRSERIPYCRRTDRLSAHDRHVYPWSGPLKQRRRRRSVRSAG
jgi:hypothetical protein